MALELVVATRNKKKVEEIRRMCEGVPVVLLSPDDFPGCPEVEEDAGTFRGNAVKKALAVSSYTRRPAVADDSGLEVNSLHGAPGVFSARYAGEEADDKKNIEKLLSLMEVTEDNRRSARFVCSIALAFPDGRVETFEGHVGGRIGREQRGTGGFGYDPVFSPDSHERTFAEMDPTEKDTMSHRGMALKKLRVYLAKELAGDRM